MKQYRIARFYGSRCMATMYGDTEDAGSQQRIFDRNAVTYAYESYHITINTDLPGTLWRSVSWSLIHLRRQLCLEYRCSRRRQLGSTLCAARTG